MLLPLILLLAASSLAAANPAATNIPKNPLPKRHHSTTTLTITTWLPAITTTRNPSDPTVTLPALITHTAGTPTFTSTITQPCLSYSFLYPPESHPPDILTFTYETRSTITVYDTAKKTTTRTVLTTPTVTFTKPINTVISRYCPNTLVVSYVDHEHLTWSWTQWAGGITHITGVCLTSSTRSTTIPGVTLPTGTTKTLEDWEYFSEGGTVATKYSVGVVYEAFPTVEGRYTSILCEGGQTVETTSTVRVTRQLGTTTVTGGAGCTKGAGRRGGTKGGTEVGGMGRRQQQPVRVETVVYTTVTVVGNQVMTLTGTAVVDVNRAVFTRTRVRYETVTRGEGATVTVCGG
ncbi:hypothetical protein B0T21DRAFT_415979 [Apiosordaria backusii]|uniref:Uncharacterized protein n=1 Tax=Apiosordaria backusii TaxID=314023 RepID=A0AA40A6W4_9PEZI|nr:hypothetical protein B0T21DRAFT_415979 [Apiosordaria backusii]